MDWSADIARLLEAIERLRHEKWVILATTFTSFVLLLALITLSIRHAKVRRQLAKLRARGEDAASLPAAIVEEIAAALTLEGGSFALIDRVLPRRPRTFLLAVLGLAAGCWVLALALTSDQLRLLSSPEWQFQPFYLATHLVVLRLFTGTFSRNFLNGAQYIDIPPEEAKAGVRRILGLPGSLLALLIAIPFCILDYQYLGSERYGRTGGYADVLMYALWCAEWLLNALIWVVLAGFLVMNCRVLAQHRFRWPIEVVLQEKQYRPFLQMSAQGATMVLGFGIVTVLYIWYTGGEVTDYLGLGITALLLVVGFVPPWMLLKAKVRRLVRHETLKLRRSIGRSAWQPKPDGGDANRPATVANVEQALAILRISYLEGLHRDLGQREAKAIVLRLLAPAVTIAWQVVQHPEKFIDKLPPVLQRFF